MTLALIIIGWFIFLAMVCVFNYCAHKNDTEDELPEKDNTRQLYRVEEFDEVIF